MDLFKFFLLTYVIISLYFVARDLVLLTSSPITAKAFRSHPVLGTLFILFCAIIWPLRIGRVVSLDKKVIVKVRVGENPAEMISQTLSNDLVEHLFSNDPLHLELRVFQEQYENEIRGWLGELYLMTKMHEGQPTMLVQQAEGLAMVRPGDILIKIKGKDILFSMPSQQFISMIHNRKYVDLLARGVVTETWVGKNPFVPEDS